MSSDTKLKEAILGVLADAGNYPESVRAALWGADVANLCEKVFRAVKESEIDALVERPSVSRVELIVNSQREKVIYGATEVATALQDDGRTLKIFLREGT